MLTARICKRKLNEGSEKQSAMDTDSYFESLCNLRKEGT